MAIAELPTTAPAAIGRVLRELRRKIKGYVWLEAAATCVTWLGLAFWFLMLVDRWWELGPFVRTTALVGAFLVAAGILWRRGWHRANAALTDRNMAMLLERRYRSFEDGLLTSVELSDRAGELDPLTQEMLESTGRVATERLREVHVGGVFNPVPLRRQLAAAGGVLASLLAGILIQPDTMRFAIQRLAGLTDQPWPRSTLLQIEGFDNRVTTIARGSDLDVVVLADTQKRVPRVVQIRYRTADGHRGRENMVREGKQAPGPGSYQRFRHTFSGVLTDRRFDVRGGDARLNDLRVRVVDSPTLIHSELHCVYPDYMRRPPATLPVTGGMVVPLGTHVVVSAQTNKDLVEARLDYLAAPDLAMTERWHPAGQETPRKISFTLQPLLADTTLSFALRDTDGISNREPIRLNLTAQPDTPPEVGVRLEGIGTAVTPQARVPLAGTVRDDYGVATLQLEYRVNDGEARVKPLSAGSAAGTITVSESFELGALRLSPGRKLALVAQATDERNLPGGEGPNVSRGEQFTLAVVTPEELRILLEARELNLRQRFDAILDEVRQTRDLLAQTNFGDVSTPVEGSATATPPPATDALAPAPPIDQAVTLRDTQVLRAGRARQNGRKNGAEVLDVAAGFEAILAELSNNRIDNSELRMRLADQIALPLRRIGGDMFAELDARLGSLNRAVTEHAATNSDPESSERRETGEDAAKTGASTNSNTGDQAQLARVAIVQFDAVIVEMESVRDKMLELETFNEAIELLREIIGRHEDITQRTRTQRQESVRSLLEGDD